MGFPYRARVNERVFLNLPGFHGGAYALRTSRTRVSAVSFVTTGVTTLSARGARTTSSRG
jgi:hypothetical protein